MTEFYIIFQEIFKGLRGVGLVMFGLYIYSQDRLNFLPILLFSDVYVKYMLRSKIYQNKKSVW